MTFQDAMATATAEIMADRTPTVYRGEHPNRKAYPVAHAYDINCGQCEEWANRVQELAGEHDVTVHDSDACHIFVEYGGRFYDAECPQGVDRWKQLPIFVNKGRSRQDVTGLAETVVSALLDSDEDLMAELGEIATNPSIGAIKFALERGQEFNQRVVDNPVPNGFVLEIGIKPIGGTTAWALSKGSRMISIRWFHNTTWGTKQHGGGYFFIKPEQFAPFLLELEDMIKEASRVVTADELVRKAYDRAIRYRYSAPRKPHARQKYTENGLYAYMR